MGMYTIEYRLPPYSADGNFVILENDKVILVVDPCAEFTPEEQRELAGRILIALERWDARSERTAEHRDMSGPDQGGEFRRGMPGHPDNEMGM